MADPQGLFEFGGFRHMMHGSVSVSHGVTPDANVIYVAPQPGPYPMRSDLRVIYGSNSIVLRNCLLDSIAFETGSDGRQFMALTILDRRWQWRDYGWIDGEYNIRESADNKVREKTKQKPRDLAELCLKAMGEKKYDVSRLPNESLPYVNWNGNPSRALQELVDGLGCRVVYDPMSDSVILVKAGVGQQLPTGFDVESDSLALDPPEVPDKIIFRAGPTVFEKWLQLEAVGTDVEGKIELIDDLTYKPTDGWKASLPPDFPEVEETEDRKQAQKCIWRWFRVKTPVDITADGQTDTIAADDIDRILPLTDERVAKSKIKRFEPKKEVQEPMPAELWGLFFPGDLKLDPEKTVQTPHGLLAKYEGSFSIDKDRGIVMTDEPLFLFGDSAGDVDTNRAVDASSQDVRPPKLWLVTGVHVKDEKTGAVKREEVEYVPPGPKLGTKPFYIERNDIQRKIWIRVSGAGPTIPVDNKVEVKRQALYYIDQLLRSFQMLGPGARSYAGFRYVTLDGALHQITWTIDGQGYARTNITRNREQEFMSLSYEERRQQTKLSELLKKEDAEKSKRKKA